MAEGKAKTADVLNIADVEKQVQAIIDNAKAEAEKIIADAKKATAPNELSNEQKKARAEREAYWNELVEVKLFRDNGKYKDDVFVSVNGENCVIKRGERVMIKRKFRNVLDQSDLQDYETSKLIEKKSDEYAKIETN